MAPFYCGTQDRHFSIDEVGSYFPRLNPIIPYVVDYFLAPRHNALWRFNPSDTYGQPRRLVLPREKETEPALVGPVSVIWRKYSKGYLMAFSLLGAYLAKIWLS
jgi:hypothetical protein